MSAMSEANRQRGWEDELELYKRVGFASLVIALLVQSHLAWDQIPGPHPNPSKNHWTPWAVSRKAGPCQWLRRWFGQVPQAVPVRPWNYRCFG